MSLMSPALGEISLWEYELRPGSLPWVCVKSGRRADQTIRVQFQNTPSAAWAGFLPRSMGRRYVVKGSLPVSMLWLTIVTTVRFVVIAALVGVVYGIWAVNFTQDPSPVVWVILGASAAILGLWPIARPRLEPTGVIFRDAYGTAWVRVRGVHPNFVAAVEAGRATATAAPQPQPQPQRT